MANPINSQSISTPSLSCDPERTAKSLVTSQLVMMYQAWCPREHTFLLNLLPQLLNALINFGQILIFATITLAGIALDMVKKLPTAKKNNRNI